MISTETILQELTDDVSLPVAFFKLKNVDVPPPPHYSAALTTPMFRTSSLNSFLNTRERKIALRRGKIDIASTDVTTDDICRHIRERKKDTFKNDPIDWICQRPRKLIATWPASGDDNAPYIFPHRQTSGRFEQMEAAHEDDVRRWKNWKKREKPRDGRCPHNDEDEISRFADAVLR